MFGSENPRPKQHPSPAFDWVDALVLLAFLATLAITGDIAFLGREKLIAFDPILYTSGARGFLEHGSYVLPELVGTPRITLYPPLSAAVNTVAWIGKPSVTEAIARLQVVQCLIGLATAWVGYRLGLRLGISRWPSALFGAATVCSNTWAYHAQNFYSEPLAQLTLLCAFRCFVEFRSGNTVGRSLAIGTFVALTLITRSAGLAIALVCLAGMVFVKGERKVLAGIAGCLPIVIAMAGWRWWSSGQKGYSGLAVQWIQDMGTVAWLKSAAREFLECALGYRMAQNSFGCIGMLGSNNLLGGSLAWAADVLFWVVGLAMTGGTIVWLRSHRWHGAWVGLCLLAYLAQLAVWPVRIATRGVGPVGWLPVLGLIAACSTLKHARVPPWINRGIQYAIGLLLLANLALVLRGNFAARAPEMARLQEFDAFASEVQRLVPATEPIGVGPMIPLANLHDRIANPLASNETVFYGPPPTKAPSYLIVAAPDLGSFPNDGVDKLASSAKNRWYLLRQR